MTPQVKEWMSADPVVIEPQASARDALTLMTEHGIRHLPVVDSLSRVVGVISIDDLRAALPEATAAFANPDAPGHTEFGAGRVGELMTFAPQCVKAETSLGEAAGLMAELRIGCLLVVEEQGGLVGILSETDALHALASTLWTDALREQRAKETDLDTLVARLRAEREHLEHSLREYRTTERRFTTHPQEEALDFAERAADRSEADQAGLMEEFVARRLEGLERALERAEHGRLHFCEQCGRRIPLARLQALPDTTLCIGCATRVGS